MEARKPNQSADNGRFGKSKLPQKARKENSLLPCRQNGRRLVFVRRPLLPRGWFLAMEGVFAGGGEGASRRCDWRERALVDRQKPFFCSAIPFATASFSSQHLRISIFEVK